ncbi:NAD(P)/FAD-dependent oxidoreductase [Niveispirillum irakense]|uniref:NAD(P)/FAD-dependent oxidoreductase n=1 Tax=Niveispirillum irakense TaxID=34011 RepID=UPI000401F79B|nr:FAD-dependent oxidoreductase [Niveispirillum irakense]
MLTVPNNIPRRRIAIIGSGAAALGAAWMLRRQHDVTLFEKNDYIGGHANTVEVPGADGRPVAVDTGFIVYNERNYPNLIRMFEELSVPTQATDMSFAVSLDGGGLEYSGGSLAGLFAQPSNLFKGRFLGMIGDILRFYREAPALLGADDQGVSLGDYLEKGRYGEAFIQDHLLPMAAAIWSAPSQTMLSFPVVSFVRFCANHGLLQLTDRPRWRTLVGGSREYVRRITEGMAENIRLNSPVTDIARHITGVAVTVAGGHTETFDEVVIATHADEALALLRDADMEERRILGAFGYQENRAVLHSDTALMPVRRRAWSAWNYLGRSGADGGRDLCVTYWMNQLQGQPHDLPLFVTLNPIAEPAAALTHREFTYHHPVFDGAAMAAQKQLHRLQGVNRTWFCGSYFGYGFHEDAFSAGLRVAAQLGCAAPWQALAMAAE